MREKQLPENIFFVQRGQNDNSGADSLRYVGFRNHGRTATGRKAVQSVNALHEIRPEDFGTYQDLLLRLRRHGRCHDGKNL
jgi:hypothetical protein